jgi:hypothetical protein
MSLQHTGARVLESEVLVLELHDTVISLQLTGARVLESEVLVLELHYT